MFFYSAKRKSALPGGDSSSAKIKVQSAKCFYLCVLNFAFCAYDHADARLPEQLPDDGIVNHVGLRFFGDVADFFL
jgi:hypothetical protein